MFRVRENIKLIATFLIKDGYYGIGVASNPSLYDSRIVSLLVYPKFKEFNVSWK